MGALMTNRYMNFRKQTLHKEIIRAIENLKNVLLNLEVNRTALRNTAPVASIPSSVL